MAVGEVGGMGEVQRPILIEPRRRQRLGAGVKERPGQGLERYRLLHQTAGGSIEKGAPLQEGEETEPLHQLHEGAGFRLGWTGAFAHLFLGADGAHRIHAAEADVDRDVQAAAVNAQRLFQDVQVQPLKTLPHPGYGLFRRTDFVQIVGIGFIGVL